jgi:hypothetical protein
MLHDIEMHVFFSRYEYKPHHGEVKALKKYLESRGYEVKDWAKGDRRKLRTKTDLDLKACKDGKTVVIELESIWEGSCNKRFRMQVLDCASLITSDYFDEAWIIGWNFSSKARCFLLKTGFRHAEDITICGFRHAVWKFSKDQL